MPGFVFQLNEATSVLADKLVEEALVPMFRKLHHEKAGWNLSLINVAATNMFRRQDEVLRDFKVTVQPENVDEAPTSYTTVTGEPSPESLGELSAAEGESGMGWESDDSDSQLLERCDLCHSAMPAFALSAHRRYHELSNQGQITP
jgi:DNA polymerase iota